MAEDKTEKKTDGKKFAGKYDTPEAMEAAYAELEKKLGEQGQHLGQMQQSLAEFQTYYKQADPIVKFYSDNAPAIKQWFDARGQNGNANGGANGVAQQAQQIAQQTEGYQWLTPQEKAGLQQEIVKHISESVVAPWQQKWEGVANQFATQLQNQNRAFTDVLWRTFERVLPPEKLAEARKWHEQALQFADPSKLDPMKVAGDFLGIQSENATLKSQVDEWKTKYEAREKAEIPSLGLGSSSLTAEAPEAPKNKQERFERVMTDTKNQSGAEGTRALFPSLG